MTIPFSKYQGTGNDFVIIDNRKKLLDKNNTKLIAHLCDRKFGIGADGCMFLEGPTNPEDDFTMVYFNADGNESTMCGNGGRCLVAFAKDQGVIDDTATFTAIDGPHKATLHDGLVNLEMQEVKHIVTTPNHYWLNTGSPHHIEEVININDFDVFNNGKRIRNGAPYHEEGTNVNFVEKVNADTFKVRTYERGVEDETLSCGTGVTAAAIAMFESGKTLSQKVNIETLGGLLTISFKKEGDTYKEVHLEGPATFVFKGEIVW